MRLTSLPENVNQAVSDMFPKAHVAGVTVDRVDTIDLFQARLKAVGNEASKKVMRRAALRGLENPRELAKMACKKAIVSEVRFAQLKLRAGHELELAHLEGKAAVRKAFDQMFAAEREHGLWSPQAKSARDNMQVVGAAAKVASDRYHAQLA